jgi:hypothetical protein
MPSRDNGSCEAANNSGSSAMRLHGISRPPKRVSVCTLAVCALAVLTLSLSGCGGGSGSGNSTPNPNQNSNPPGSVTPSATAIATNPVSTSTQADVLLNPMSFTVPSSGTYYYQISFVGTAITGVSVNGVTSTDYNTGNSVLGSTPALGYAIGATIHGTWTGTLGINQIQLVNPQILGAGVYQDSMTLHVCQDAACATELAGSPVTIPLTYTVTGNAIPSGTITVYQNAEVEFPGSQTTPASASIIVDGINLPPTGARVTTGTSANGFVTQTTFSSSLATNPANMSSGQLSLTLESPSTAGVGIHTDTVPINVCFDTACQKPATGGPWTGAVTYIVDPVAGVDYTQTSIAISTAGIVWDSQTNTLYAIIPAYSALDANTLAEINPYSGTIEQAVQLDGGVGRIEPGTLAVSDDGQYLYVAVSDSAEQTDHIERLLTSNLGLDATITLPSFELVAALATAPGAAQTVAVQTSGNSPELVIYDNTTARPNTLTGQSGNTLVSFTWGADSSTIYATFSGTTGTLDAVSATSTGLQVTNSFSSLPLTALGGPIQFAGGLVCWNSGMTFDPVAFAVSTPFSAQTSTNPSAAFDTSLERAYFITTDQAPGNNSTMTTNIESFNFSTRDALWILRFPSQNPATQLTRWGTNGLAFAETAGATDSLVLISGPLVTQ